MNKVMGAEYVSLNVSVAEGKQKGEEKSLPWFLAVITKECGDSGRSFAKTWMEAQKSGRGRKFRACWTDFRKSFTLPD